MNPLLTNALSPEEQAALKELGRPETSWMNPHAHARYKRNDANRAAAAARALSTRRKRNRIAKRSRARNRR